MGGGIGKLATVAAVAGTVIGAVIMQNSIEDRVADLETRVAVLEGTAVPQATNTAEVEAEVHDMRGWIDIIDPDNERLDIGGECQGERGYDDLAPGADVVVSDETGLIIASGRLEDGVVLISGDCRLPFFVADVPRANFYTIEISSRDGVTYSHAEMEGANWAIQMSIGSR